MAIERKMDIVDVLVGILDEGSIDTLIDKQMTVQEWEIEVTSYRPGSPGRIAADPGDSYPEEPADYEIDMTPDVVATMITTAVADAVDGMPERMAKDCFEEIRKAEEKWQRENLDAAVAAEMAHEDY